MTNANFIVQLSTRIILYPVTLSANIHAKLEVEMK